MARTLLKVLLVEDDPDHAEFVKLSLAEADLTTFELERADNLAAALDRLQGSHYDVILLDLELPDACGFEALSEVRDRYPDIPVAVLTSNSDPRVGVEAASKGAHDYLYKGDMNARTLERAIRYAVHHQELFLQLRWFNGLLDQKNDELQAANGLLNRTNEDLHAANELADGRNDELETMNDLLDQKNNQLQTANELLDKKNAKLAELYETAQQFVDNVSHEFRTPLTVIKEYASIMRDGLAGQVTEQQRDFLDIVTDRTDDLAIMVDDMLDVSKLEAGLLSAWRRESKVCDIFAHVRPVLERKAAIKKVMLEISPDDDLPDVYCDPEKVGRVIINLTTNAIKFCGNGGGVKVWARRNENRSEVEIGVTDEGPGIAPENLQLIFKRFHQAGEGIKSSTKGFGLGLGIARELVDLNLGEMHVESELGKGSTFSFTVPLCDPDELAIRYSKRIRASDDRPECVALVVATVDAPLEQAVSNAVDEFLQHTFRANDFVVRILTHKWLVMARCPGTEVDDMLDRLQAAWVETNRNMPGAKLPEITLRAKGAWPAETSAKEAIEQFQLELAAATEEPKGARVLLVDDDRELVQGLSIRLEAAGYEVITALNGKSAVDRAIEQPPDAILMDNYMPVLSGLEALELLRENPRTMDVPVIMLSASARDQQEALKQGASYFLHKPCGTGAIMTALREVIAEPCLAGTY